MPNSSKFRDLNTDEEQFVSSALKVGRDVCAYYFNPGKTLSLPTGLDVVYEAWAGDTHPGKPSPNEVCFGLGALLGDCIVSNLDFRWCMELDKDEDEYCVRHPEGWQSCPFHFVGKRIHEQEPQGGFFRALYDLLRERPQGLI